MLSGRPPNRRRCAINLRRTTHGRNEAAVDLDQLLEALLALAELVPPNLVELMQLIQVMRPFPISTSTSTSNHSTSTYVLCSTNAVLLL